MNRCKDCRWWGHEQDQPFRSYDLETRQNVESPAKRCGSPKLHKIDSFDLEYSDVTGDLCALDYPVCDLVTGPDFGCVNQEPR